MITTITSYKFSFEVINGTGKRKILLFLPNPIVPRKSEKGDLLEIDFEEHP